MDLKARMLNAIQTSEVQESDKIVLSRILPFNDKLDEPIVIKQRDHNSRLLNITVKKNSETPLSLINSRVILIIQRPDGIKVVLEGDIKNATLGEVEFSLTKDCVERDGKAKCEIVRLGEDGTTLSSPSFDITIEESLYDDFMLGFGEDEFTKIE